MTNPPKEIMVWCSHEKMGHIGTWATTRYPEDSVSYIPKSEFNKVKEAAELGLQMTKVSTNPGFNPSGKSEVDVIKEKTEELITYIEENVPANRQRSIALTNYEQAAMWAVKANFS